MNMLPQRHLHLLQMSALIVVLQLHLGTGTAEFIAKKYLNAFLGHLESLKKFTIVFVIWNYVESKERI